MYRCPNPLCGREIELEWRYCSYCRVRLQWECESCGMRFDVGKRMSCPFCGALIKGREENKHRESFQERERRREERFWALQWPEEKVIGVVLSPISKTFFQKLRERDREAYARVYDALCQIWVHREETGSVLLPKKGGCVYLMGEMEHGEKAWVSAILREAGLGRFLDEYETKLALKEAKKTKGCKALPAV